jgi:hypothetical protein
MNIDHNGNVWCHCCLKWHDINTETLWIPRDDGRVDIVCMDQYPERYIHLGFDDNLQELPPQK